MTYRSATTDDIETLVSTRVKLIDEDSGLDDVEKKNIYDCNKEYMQNAMPAGQYFAFLAYDSDVFVGTCSACLYSVLPGKKLPKGKNAYIQNVYVSPLYRRRGVGKVLVKMTVNEALARGHARITLSATQMGAALFKECGFQFTEDTGLTEMVYTAL